MSNIEIIEGDLTKQKGILCHQVNCQDRIGVGLSKAMIDAFPLVKKKYHEIFRRYRKRQVLGHVQHVEINEDVRVVNFFTQFYFGNAKKSGRVYTDYPALDRALSRLVKELYHNNNLRNKTIYFPYLFGAGLAGGDWKTIDHLISTHLKDFDVKYVKLSK